MALQVPEVLSQTGILFCVLCNDSQTPLFQAAKKLIGDLPIEELGLRDPCVLEQFPKNGWYPYPEVTLLKVVQGHARGRLAAGVGTNKNKYTRAAALALAIAVDLEIGDRDSDWLRPVVNCARNLRMKLQDRGTQS